MIPVRFSLKLKDGASPHLYVTQMKKLMENDETLHPQMERTLKMLKKTRQSFVTLAMLKELVIDGDNYRHFERCIKPKGTGWVKTYWSKEERDDYDNDSDLYIKNIFKSMEGLGYEFFNPMQMDDEFMKYLEDMTSKQQVPTNI